MTFKNRSASNADEQQQRRSYLREFRAQHGHHPEDIKARIDCVVCQTKSLVEHTIIAVEASGDPARYASFINETGYNEEVKAAARLHFEEKS